MSAELTITERIYEILADVAEIDVSSDDADLLESGRIDSLSLVELIFALELDFGILLPLEELDVEDFRTARSIAQLVASVSADGAGPAAEGDYVSSQAESSTIPT
ncbi:MAG: hypothetical protein H0U00_05805 [Actinobacteria bacterium]|nr:hypothetical protein [Actinomycetota bacterium]